LVKIANTPDDIARGPLSHPNRLRLRGPLHPLVERK